MDPKLLTYCTGKKGHIFPEMDFPGSIKKLFSLITPILTTNRQSLIHPNNTKIHCRVFDTDREWDSLFQDHVRLSLTHKDRETWDTSLFSTSRR